MPIYDCNNRRKLSKTWSVAGLGLTKDQVEIEILEEGKRFSKIRSKECAAFDRAVINEKFLKQ